MRNVLVSVLGLMLLAGCAAETSSDSSSSTSGAATDTSNDEIIGGTADTADPAIIALFAHKEGDNQGSLCTSTLIAPTVLLTAAHCVSPQTVGEGMTFVALTGPSLVDSTNPSGQIAVAETHFDPEFDSNNLPNGHDIAVAILAQPYAGVTPMPWNKGAIPSSLAGTKVRAVGYGLNNGIGQSGAGVKRQAQIKLNSIDSKMISTGSAISGICSGDSGGPILAKINGVETIIAVNSYGLIFCLGASHSTRVDAYKSFVEQYVGN